MAFFQLGLRRAAAHLARVPVACGPCLRQQLPVPPARVLKLTRAARSYASTSATESKSPIASLSGNITNSAAPAAQTASSQSSGKSSSFPKTNAKVVGYWLIGSAASVFGIVVFGGLTRLTESGYVAQAGDF
jgi:cytochrome c oxidase assembly protein subunit 15